MSIVQASGHLVNDVLRLSRACLLVLRAQRQEVTPQVGAMHQFHHDVMNAVLFAIVIDLDDVGVAQRGDGARLAPTALVERRVILPARDDLDGDLAL
jgi:hypothetical protein